MNIYLLYGNDQALIKKEIDNIIEKNKIKEESINEYTLPEAGILDIVEDANTIGMFSTKKAIIVGGINIFYSSKVDKIEYLEEYLNNPNPDTYLIFKINEEKIDTRKKLVKLIEKKGKIIEFNKKNITNIKKYIEDYLKDNSYQMSSYDIDYLNKRLGNNLDLVMNELDKLMLYKIEEKIITKEDIDSLTEPLTLEEIFNLTDAVIKNDVKRSLELYHYFLENNYDSLQMLAMLGNQFRLLFQVKRLTNKGYNEATISKELGVHPYRVKLAVQTNYNYSENDYLKYLYKLATIDELIKRGEVDKDLSLELFLLKKDMDI
jgi:DNA polymerase-3 subunit delta